jgi:hypothetical protein
MGGGQRHDDLGSGAGHTQDKGFIGYAKGAAEGKRWESPGV